MEKAELREAPYEVGRARLFDQMNSHAGPFTHVCRLANPEGARMLLQYISGVRVEAWHQSDTVVVLSAPTWEMQLSADELIMATQSSVEDQWDQAGRDD